MKFIYKARGNWYGPYSLARTLNPWRDPEAAEAFIEKWGNRFSRIKPLENLFEWIESKRKDTVKAKLDHWDHFDAYTVIAAAALPLLKAMREDMRGSAIVDEEDVPEAVTAHLTEDEKIHARWEWVVDEIIWALEQVQPNYDWEEQYYDIDKSYELREEHQKQMANGFRLFGKYFMNLWV